MAVQNETAPAAAEDASRMKSAPHPDGGIVFVRPLRLDELPLAEAVTHTQLDPSVGSVNVAATVLKHNQESFWGVFRADDDTHTNARFVGYLSFLFLNEKGAQHLRSNTLNTRVPDLSCVAADGEPAEIIYMWSFVIKRLASIAIPLVAFGLGASYAGLPLCATAATEAGLRALRGFGFTPMRDGHEGVGEQYWLGGNTDKPKVENAKRTNPMHDRFKVKVATTGDEVQMAMAIRAAAFLAEQDCPYEEEFDGNDYTGTHLIGYVDGQPAATMRIRYFADFAKLERMAVLPRFRRTLIARSVVKTAVDFVRRKGYRKVYGHGQKRLLRFWAQFGFKPIAKNVPLVFSDHEYVELVGELEPHPEPLTIHSDPYVLIRPEGAWDDPGVLDKSSSRPATNPH